MAKANAELGVEFVIPAFMALSNCRIQNIGIQNVTSKQIWHASTTIAMACFMQMKNGGDRNRSSDRWAGSSSILILNTLVTAPRGGGGVAIYKHTLPSMLLFVFSHCKQTKCIIFMFVRITLAIGTLMCTLN